MTDSSLLTLTLSWVVSWKVDTQKSGIIEYDDFK